MGARSFASERGLTVGLEGKEAFYGEVAGGLPHQQSGNWTTELKINLLLDFSKSFGLDGFSAVSQWRYRNLGNNPEYVAGTGYSSATSPSFTFNPSADTSGLGVRILPQYLQYTARNGTLTLNAGWENPYDQFLQQPLSKFFENNEIHSAKGIGATAGPGVPVVNGIRNASGQVTKSTVGYYNTSPVPWSSSYAAWGATLKVKPTRETYIQSGLYMAIANTGDIGGTQFSPTSVYPYTSVPANYRGTFKSSGQVVPVAGGNGQIISGARQDIGFVRSQSYNHGFNFQGAPQFSPYVPDIGAKPSTPANATYRTGGRTVAAPAYYASSPYNPGNNNQYSQNGLYTVDELGWKPRFGSSRLEGHYALGGYLWGQANDNYTARFTPSVFPSCYRVTTGGTKTHPAYAVYPGTSTAPTYTSYDATKPGAFQQNQLVWGLYAQADQELWRMPSGDSPGEKENIPDRGLHSFNEFSFTPPQNNAMPFYFQSGLVLKGPVRLRPADSVGVAIGSGFYSCYLNSYTSAQNKSLENPYGSTHNAVVPDGPVIMQPVNPGTGTPASIPSSSLHHGIYGKPASTQALSQSYYAYLPSYSSTQVVEFFYNIEVTKWVSLKPYAQFIANPAGNGTVENDWILGATAKLSF